MGDRKDGDMPTRENLRYLTNPDGIAWQVKVGNVTINAGKNSLIGHAPELAAVGVWLAGTSKLKAIKGGFDRNWTLLGAGDCTGDGKDDLVFSHTETGSVMMYPASTTSKILGQLDGHHLI